MLNIHRYHISDATHRTVLPVRTINSSTVSVCLFVWDEWWTGHKHTDSSTEYQ